MTYHFIGLGGIGMSALARILLQRGMVVQGSDVRPSALLERLAQEGAKVHIGHSASLCEEATVAVYNSDIRSDNVELQRARERKIPILHRSELLHALMEGKKPLLVTGTHGKTTVTALLSSVLEEGGLEPSFVIGGIHRGWNTNGRGQEGEFFVAEADESDHSFIKTAAFGAIVTNLDNDHLSYWKEPVHLEAAFQQFFSQATSEEHVFWCGDDARLRALKHKGVSYGFGKDNALRIERFESTAEGVRFSIVWKQRRYCDIDLRLYGRHNALNGAAVFGLALALGVAEAAIRSAFMSFAGTARRLEWKGSARGIDVYDDYGHHPTEIETTLKALRTSAKERRLVVVFQPHRYTRVRDCFREFLECFSEADVLVVTDIYGGSEAPIEGVSAERLAAELRTRLGGRVHLFSRDALEEKTAELLQPYDVVLTLGAGDVTHAGDRILQRVESLAPMLKIGVLFGGTSSEHAVSLMSAGTIVKGLSRQWLSVKQFAISKEGQWRMGDDAPSIDSMISAEVLQALMACDVVVPVFHGPQGEDGMMQGFLDTLNLPYVGSDYRGSALCMHKGWTKHVAKMFGVPTAAYLELDEISYFASKAQAYEKIERELRYPIWIKPAHLGSSVGVSRVASSEELAQSLETAFAFDDVVIAEEEVDGREVEFSLLGNEFIRVAMAGEIIKPDRFHGYDQKYGPTASPIQIPAPLTERQREIGEEMAREMYRRAGCKGMARIDFFLDKQGHFWLNEINPFPGFTATSAFPAMWQATGLSIEELCDELLILALHKHRRLQRVRGR